MEKNRVDELIAKYNEGLADPSELKWIEQLIESGEVQLTQLHELAALDSHLMKMDPPAPTLRLDDEFYSMLANEKRKQRISRLSFSLPDWSVLFPRMAFAMTLLVLGFFAGYLFMGPSQNTEVDELTQKVSELNERVMLALLEKESATDRLKAVNLTSEMGNVSQKVTSALFQTLNNDENVNVRLAALDALTLYVKDSNVREGLVQSISHQDSPMVQVALAEVMVSIVEKKSVKELQKIIDNQRTPSDVKNKIQESIRVLI
uniref:Uncharacterized protein n=1 Tax=uncultured bacterium BLR19 TaxID=506519 RepID=C0INY2_9BACT|nr:hypothetical protein AKSOIL_0310 [uncultured bacterium BLR19]